MQCEHSAADGSETDDIEVYEESSIGSKNSIGSSDVDSDAEEGVGTQECLDAPHFSTLLMV
jgi:hypothetical protein